MSVRGLLPGLLALALSTAWLGAAEAPKAPVPQAPEPAKAASPAEAKAAPEPGKAAPAPKATETAAQRADRLGKLYDRAELLRKDGFLRDAQKAYAQVALEDPSFRYVASRLRELRVALEAEERHDREERLARLLDAADAQFASGDYQAAAKACEAALAIDEKNVRAQTRLTSCASELELRRRLASIFSEPAAAGDRQVVAQAKTALDEKAPALEAPPKDAAPAIRSVREVEPAPPKAARVVRPGENTEAEPAAAAKGRPLDPAGARLVAEAWDLYQSAKNAQDPKPALRKANYVLDHITPTGPYSQQTKDAAALLRASIARRLADEGSDLDPAEARRIRLYQRFAVAEEAFRNRRYDEALDITSEILAEDRTFSLARNLSQEARIRQHDDKVFDTEIEHQIILDKTFDTIDNASIPPVPASPIERPTVDLKRPSAEIASAELEEKLNQRISVNLIKADLDYVLDLLFRSTGVNIIYNPEVVKGKEITIHVANFPLKELLDYIAANHGMVFSKIQDGVLITTPDQPRLETFVVPLHYGIVDVTKAPPTGGDLAKGGTAKPIDPESSSNLEQVLDNLDKLTDWPQGSFYYLDRQMNIVYFRTTRETYQKVLEILDAVDQIPVNILIKAKFIEVDANDFDSYGTELSLTPAQITTTTTDASGNTTTSSTDDPNSHTQGKFSFPADGFPKGETAGTFTFSGVCNHDQYKLTLSALQRMGRSRVLTAPNIICMNNCTAAIAVTTTLIYIEDYQVDRSDISGTTYGSNPYQQVPTTGTNVINQPLSSEPILIPVFSKDEYEGFMFDVTASVGQDTRFVTLSLNPRIRTKVDEVSFDVVLPTTQTTTSTTGTTSATGSTNNKVTIVRPILDERSLSTKLTVRDGSVVALGGMMSHNKTAVRDKIPILGDIPFVGGFFTKRSYTDDRRNLLIFLECQVITPSGARYADAGPLGDLVPPPKAGPRVGLREERAPAVRPAP